MRKIKPQDIRDQFHQFTVERLAHFGRLETLLKGSAHEKRDMSVLAETTLHSTYVAFECFLSDLILAYINRDFSAYQADLQSRLVSSVTSKFGTWAGSRTTFSAVKHIKVQDLEALVDPTGWNLTFKTVNDFQDKCRAWVAAPYNTAILALNASDVQLIDATRAVRNFIAHGSSGSRVIMNTKLAQISTGPACANNPLARGAHEITDVGSYLKSSVNGKRRVKMRISVKVISRFGERDQVRRGVLRGQGIVA